MKHTYMSSDTHQVRWVRRLFIVFTLIFCSFVWQNAIAQSANWTWVGGKPVANTTTVFSGTNGVADPCNAPGGRVAGNTWVDLNGDLWMQGGDQFTTNYYRTNELWKFDPELNAWTRMKSGMNYLGNYGTQGVEAPTNIPGGRVYAYNWQDAAGNFWYFGGDGFGAGGGGQMNDLWFYNVSTNNWKFVWGVNNPGAYGGYGHPKGIAGPNNGPGGRSGGVYWIGDDGKLWMMGGLGYGYWSWGQLNEVWNYDPVTGYWTWVSGDNTANHNGIYGLQGVPDLTNMPGGRVYFDSWKDAFGDIWIFGGYGYGETGGLGYLSDLWKYSPDENLWTWMGGPKTANVPGTYGSMGALDFSSWPGARGFYKTFVDSNGKFWLFGGNDNNGKFNDWWMFDPDQNGLCGYMGGVGVVNANGIYGALGETESGGTPGARTMTYGWSGADGTMWMFGGSGYGTGASGYLNDMWAFNFTENMLYMDSDADGIKNSCDTDDDADGIPDGEDVCQYVNQATFNCDDGNAATYDFFDVVICDCSHLYLDADNDGYTYDVDCNDNDASINPGRPFDFVNGIDENCDGLVDNVAPNNAFNMPIAPSAYSAIVVEDDEALHFDYTTPGTIEFWMRSPQEQSGTHIISKRPFNYHPMEFQIANIHGVGLEVAAGYGPQFNTGFIPPDNEWTHVAFTYSYDAASDYSEVILYVNGCYYGSWNAFLFYYASNNPLTIGNIIILPEWGALGNPEYKGDLDEVRIWNVTRTAAEIQASYNTTIDPIANPALVAYYTFDQGIAGGDNTAITQVFDATLNQLHGTIQNLPMNGDQGNFVNGWDFTPTFNWYYADLDGDGFGDADDTGLYVDCYPGAGYVLNNVDCNDADININPNMIEICGNMIDDNCDGAVDENCCAITVEAGAPEYLYYGFAADQSVTITAVRSGGMAPFNYAWTLDRDLLYNVETASGDESMLNANTQSVTISLMDTAMLYITVTDAWGCQAIDSVIIYAEDVRCFKGDKEKVLICHSTGSAKNPWTQMCIDEEAVDAHLAHGDYLGKCGTPRESYMNEEEVVRSMNILPNPSDGHCTVVLSLPDVPDGEIFLHVSDLTGRVLLSEQGYLEAGGVEFELHIDPNFASGIYMVWTDINGNILHRNMVINR